MTPHNEAKKEEIADIVIMPGDPLRAKYIAENFLTDAKLVNSVRNMYAYTGTYKGKKITVMASGMGMPSMGIYAYELYKFYEVTTIIRIGSCGAYDPNLKLFDIILSENCFTEGNFALTANNEDCHIIASSQEINQTIENTAKEQNINLVKGNTICSEYFDVYLEDLEPMLNRVPKDFHPISAEMEAFALFYTANLLGKKAACLMSVVDSKFIKEVATAEQREKGLNEMITLALESSLKL